MTASNGVRTEYKIKRLAAVVALAIAAMLAAASLSPARADAAGTSDGNIVIDVPTTVPCALMADGTVVGTSEWKITTSGDAYVASASASGFPANVEWSARTTDLAAAQAGSVQVSGTGDAATVAGPSDPAAAKLAQSAGFEWSFSKLDAGENSDIIAKAAGGTAVLGSVTFTFAKTEPVAFAVYSADDNSLSFYKRADVPVAGQTFEGKTATEVFTGFETETYGSYRNVPWSDCRDNVKRVTVVDEGLAPVSTSNWFYSFSNAESFDLSKLSTTNVETMRGMFIGCSALTSLDLSSFDTGSVEDMSNAFARCESLTVLDLSSFNTGRATNISNMFRGCTALTTLDLSSFDTANVTRMSNVFDGCSALQKVTFGENWKWVGTNGYLPTPDSAYISGADGYWYDADGNGCAPADIPSNKAMTYTAVSPKTAFAVYSADDNSLNFYKRVSVPSAGDQFEGKTATEVYEGLSSYNFNANMFNLPWKGVKKNVKRVLVADEGFAPDSTAGWFELMSSLESVDISKLDTSSVMNTCDMFYGCKALTALDLSSFDTSSVVDISRMFHGCESLTSLDLSSFDTSSVTDMTAVFEACSALTSLDLSSFDTSSVTDMGGLFYGCKALTSLNLSSFDTSSVMNTCDMFYGCKALTALDLSSFDTSSVVDISRMFLGCESLASLDLSSFDMRNVSKNTSMFGACYRLQKVTFGENWKWVGTNGYLPTPDSAYISGADGYWYDADGNGYAPADIPSSKAMTYTAVAPKSAFAVYSADDNSLSLYKRSSVPTAGDTFEGKTATEVYEGVEKASYTAADGAPWSGHAADIASVTVADDGVAPISTAYWFKGASKLNSVSLAGLDTSQTTCMDGMFDGCSSLEALDLSSMSTRRVASMTAFLGGCDSLAELSIGSEFAWVDDDCYPPTGDWKQGSTGTDYSESDIPANKTDKYTRAKTAFAVYSADDQSLTFYKRPVAPAEGAQFLGKTASKVFTGFETGTYSPSSVPWAAYRSNVKTVTVADAGVAPVSTKNWFYFFTNATSIDLSKLDTANVTDMNSLFYGCESLTSLDLSSFDTANVTDMRSLFQDCNALTVLDLSSFDTGSVTNMACIFSECSSLERISLGTGFKWVGWNCYPRSGNWESSSTGKVYSAREIPSGVADTYLFKPNTKASTAVNAASNPANNDATIAAMTSTGDTQGESAIQEATEGKPTLEEKTSKESDVTAEPEGTEKNSEGEPAFENEATKEDISAIVPEGAEKATVKKSGE